MMFDQAQLFQFSARRTARVPAMLTAFSSKTSLKSFPSLEPSPLLLRLIHCEDGPDKLQNWRTRPTAAAALAGSDLSGSHEIIHPSAGLWSDHPPPLRQTWPPPRTSGQYRRSPAPNVFS